MFDYKKYFTDSIVKYPSTKQMKEITERMWENRRIKRGIRFAFGRNDVPKEIVKERLMPEWVCLIDKDGKLRSCRYGFAAPWAYPPIRPVQPQEYSLGTVHYHPIKKPPSSLDIMGWANRYLETNERLFCIHDDEESTCYEFKVPKDEIEEHPLLRSFVMAFFGVPKVADREIKDWFNEKIEEGEIIVKKAIDDEWFVCSTKS